MPYPYFQPYQMPPMATQQMQQMQMSTPTPQATYMNNKTWVSGEAGAKAYLVAPNSDVTLWDSEAQVIYLKSADASGLPSMKILDYTIRGAQEPTQPLEVHEPISNEEYVLKADFDALKGELEALKEQMKHVPKQTTRPKQKGGANL